jgi:hypothetical protein
LAQIKDAILKLAQEELEDIKVVIRIRKFKEEQTTQWAKDKEQKDKQRSTKHYI